MKYLLLIVSFFSSLVLLAQTDTGKPIEPEHKTSFEQYELLVLAILGFLLLMGLRYWFKRTRKM